MNATHLIFFFWDGEASETTVLTSLPKFCHAAVYVPGVQTGATHSAGVQQNVAHLAGVAKQTVEQCS